MERMEVGGEGTDEGEDAEVDQYEAEAEGVGGGLLALEVTSLLTQDTDPYRTTIIDACNFFNEVSRLAMLWTVHHRWPSGAMFAFDCYSHWVQILLHQPSDTPFILLIR